MTSSPFLFGSLRNRNSLFHKHSAGVRGGRGDYGNEVEFTPPPPPPKCASYLYLPPTPPYSAPLRLLLIAVILQLEQINSLTARMDVSIHGALPPSALNNWAVTHSQWRQRIGQHLAASNCRFRWKVSKADGGKWPQLSSQCRPKWAIAIVFYTSGSVEQRRPAANWIRSKKQNGRLMASFDIVLNYRHPVPSWYRFSFMPRFVGHCLSIPPSSQQETKWRRPISQLQLTRNS